MAVEWTQDGVSVIPAIALRGLTVFPSVMIHFDVSREISAKALEDAMASGSPQNTMRDMTEADIKKLYMQLW